MIKKGGREGETRMSLLTKAANQTSSTPPNPSHQRRMDFLLEGCLRIAGHLKSSTTCSPYLGLQNRTLFWLHGMHRTALYTILITRVRYPTCVIL